MLAARKHKAGLFDLSSDEFSLIDRGESVSPNARPLSREESRMAVAGHPCFSHGHADGHFVRFYQADSLLADEVAEFADRALCSGGSAIVIATRAHAAAITA